MLYTLTKLSTKQKEQVVFFMKFNTILAAKTDVTLFIGVVDER
jgi:hypothetical protein